MWIRTVDLWIRVKGEVLVGSLGGGFLASLLRGRVALAALVLIAAALSIALARCGDAERDKRPVSAATANREVQKFLHAHPELRRSKAEVRRAARAERAARTRAQKGGRARRFGSVPRKTAHPLQNGNGTGSSKTSAAAQSQGYDPIASPGQNDHRSVLVAEYAKCVAQARPDPVKLKHCMEILRR